MIGIGNSILNQPASNYVQTGEALLTIENVWGISLSNQSGEITLGELTDQMFNYLQNSTGGGAITKDQMSIALEPGNSVHSILHRLFVDPAAISAVQNRLLADSQ